MQISRSRFKQSLFCEYLGIFGDRISKMYGNWKFGRFDVVLELEFVVKNW